MNKIHVFLLTFFKKKSSLVGRQKTPFKFFEIFTEVIKDKDLTFTLLVQK